MTDFQDAFEEGKKSKIVMQVIEGIEHVLIPKDCSLKSMEHLLPAPTRIKAHPSFTDLAGFADYIKEFAGTGSRIFVDEDRKRFTTIFDSHSKDQPAWGDHSASIDLKLSPEWKRFKEYDGKVMKPIDFADFIEDNLAYISAKDMDASDLLTMAQTFKIKVKGDIQTSETLHSGLKSLVIKDDSSLSASNANGQEVKFPETINLNIRFFKNCATYPVQCFLRYRIKDSQLYFFIKIPDPQGLEDEAFDAFIGEVKTVTGLVTLKGAFEGPSHR